MPSPVITFRLSHYQLARGLQIVRAMEPNFKLTSFSHLVKVIYTDYIAKMSLGHNDQIEPEILEIIQTFIQTSSKEKIKLSDLVTMEENLISSTNQTEKTASKISTVTDFSPPTDWIDQEV